MKILRFFGSLWVAVAVMAIFVIVLPWATFVEAKYGAGVSKWFVYDSSWFYALFVILGLNVFFAMLVRLPWRRSHLPFLVSHLGVLLLLAGCFLTHKYGEEARLTLLEGRVSRTATSTKHQELSVRSFDFTQKDGTGPLHEIEFDPGPFDWRFYDDPEAWRSPDIDYVRSLTFLSGLIRPNRKIECKENGLEIELIDYYRFPTVLFNENPFQVNIKTAGMEEPENFSMQLQYYTKESPPAYRLAMKTEYVDRKETKDGTLVSIAWANSRAEIESLLKSPPENLAESGRAGQIVLWYGGESFRFPVDKLLKERTEGMAQYSLGDSGLRFSVQNFDPRDYSIILNVSCENIPETEDDIPLPGTMRLSALNPESNYYPEKYGVFGSYWADLESMIQDETDLSVVRQKRLELVQSPDGKLFYRYSTIKEIISCGEIDTGVLDVAHGTDRALHLKIDRFIPCIAPGVAILGKPLPGMKTENPAQEQFLKVRTTLDGNTEEFWIDRTTMNIFGQPAYEPKWIYGKNRSIALRWRNEPMELGFGIWLKKFSMKTDPGTTVASHFSSLVEELDIVPDFKRDPESVKDSGDPERWLDGYTRRDSPKEVLIRMNRPGTFTCPINGKSYRFYQESRQGPYTPDMGVYDLVTEGRLFYGEQHPREQVFMSTLLVNYDPGRGLKYFGSFLIVFASAWLCYRKLGGLRKEK